MIPSDYLNANCTQPRNNLMHSCQRWRLFNKKRTNDIEILQLPQLNPTWNTNRNYTFINIMEIKANM